MSVLLTYVAASSISLLAPYFCIYLLSEVVSSSKAETTASQGPEAVPGTWEGRDITLFLTSLQAKNPLPPGLSFCLKDQKGHFADFSMYVLL